MSGASHTPPKKKVCIIHKEGLIKNHGEAEHLVKPKDYESWKTLADAATLREHRDLLEIAENTNKGEVPEVYYHRQCRSVFTMKKELTAIKRKRESSIEISSDEKADRSEIPRRRSSGSRVYEKICIFCDKVVKYVNRQREFPIQATQLRSDLKLRDIATRKCDQKILKVTSRDIIAAEAHYHKTCYRNYTRPRESQENTSQDQEESSTLVENQVFQDFYEYVRSQVIDSQVVATMVGLTEELERLMKSRGLEVSVSAKKHLRRMLETEFASSIDIFPDANGKLLVISANTSLRETIKSKISLEKELDKLKLKVAEAKGMIDQSALYLRSTIRNATWDTPWPVLPSDLSMEQFALPEHLQRFFLALLTSDPEAKNLSPRVNLLVESFCHDIIYAVTCGRIKPPKQILLSYGVKTLTGNVELIQILNRFGHCVSYSQLEENDTALCLQKLAANLNQSIILPGTIQPNVFTNLAWDNIDRLEETLTGEGTSHRVNGIAVQPTVYGPHLPPNLPSIPKKKQRTIMEEARPLRIYIAGERVGPKCVSVRNDLTDAQIEAAREARNKNLLWIVARRSVDDEDAVQKIPSRTGFNIAGRNNEVIMKDVVSYLPTINAPATQLTTVSEILQQSEDIRQRLNLPSIVVVMDQALYAKACEIKWKNSDNYDDIVLRLGTFHTICNVLSIIGKRFQDAGLRDICIESGILAEGSVSSVMDGKMYNRGVRIHKYIYEALMRLVWKQFLPWVSVNHPEKLQMLQALEAQVNIFSEDWSQDEIDKVLSGQGIEQASQLLEKFMNTLRSEKGDLSAFWMSYIDVVEEVLLGLIRASREGNWILHLNAIRKMIPWCFAYDKVNYSRYLPVYYAEMMNLSSDYPEVYSSFLEGRFAVQISDGSSFGRIPVDQTTEVTVNKDTKTTGGVTKFSLRTGAVNRFFMTAEYRCGFLSRLRDAVQVKRPSHHHDDMLSSRKVKDERAVSAVESLIEIWNNPFDDAKPLVSISTATKAPEDVKLDLMEASKNGEEAYRRFKEERLESSPPTKRFHDAIKLLKLKSFSSINKKRKILADGRTLILKADRSLFGRIIVLGQNRKIEVRELLSYSLGPLPWSLATNEGFPRKNNKASLANVLQANIQLADSLPLVQKVNVGGGPITYKMVASSLLSMALREGSNSSRIDVVFDTYRDNSI